MVAAGNLQTMFAEKINVQMLLNTMTELPTPIKRLRGMTEIKDFCKDWAAGGGKRWIIEGK